MVGKLYKLADISSRLRNAHLEKVALLGKALSLAVKVGKTAIRNPVGALGVTAAGVGGVSTFKQNKAGFQAAGDMSGYTPQAL